MATVKESTDSTEGTELDNWEDMEDAGVLDRKLNEFLPSKSSQNSEKSCNGTQVTLVGDDAHRTQYMPPEPTVKILKRPSTGNSNDKLLANGDAKPRQPFKTLRQREREYAEARLRILGEAKSPEETCSESSANKLLTGILRPSELDGVIRLPRGPDGTKGFKVRR